MEYKQIFVTTRSFNFSGSCMLRKMWYQNNCYIIQRGYPYIELRLLSVIPLTDTLQLIPCIRNVPAILTF